MTAAKARKNAAEMHDFSIQK